MKVGIMFGCFIPLHKGHMKLIDRSFKENDHTIIAVCGKDSDRGKDYIPFRDRIRLIKSIYKDATVVILDDDELRMDGTFTLANWTRWAKAIFDQSGFDPNDKAITYTWYTGEESYKEKLSMVYPDHRISLADRNEDGLSGTKIRNDTRNYKDSIHPEFLKYLTLKGGPYENT